MDQPRAMRYRGIAPPAMLPTASAAKGIHAYLPRSARLKPRSCCRYFGIQKVRKVRDRIQKDARHHASPGLGEREKLDDRYRPGCGRSRAAVGENQRSFVSAQSRVCLRTIVETRPDGNPEESERAVDREGRPPAEGQRYRRDDRRRQRAADRRPGIEDAHRQRALTKRKPFGRRPNSGREVGWLGGAEQKPEEGQADQACCQPMQHRHDGPCRDEQHESLAYTDGIDDPSTYGVHHRVAEKERRCDVRVLHVGEVQLSLDRRR